jgi:hypothetical protein
MVRDGALRLHTMRDLACVVGAEANKAKRIVGKPTETSDRYFISVSRAA